MNKNQAWEKKQILKERAKEFRKKLTPQEKILWQALRQKKLGGYYFRRQYVIGPFIVDFCCVRNKVVVEVEGSVHEHHKEYDQQRARWLRTKGYTVLRFPNSKVEKNLDTVLSEIMRACEVMDETPSAGRIVDWVLAASPVRERGCMKLDQLFTVRRGIETVLELPAGDQPVAPTADN